MAFMVSTQRQRQPYKEHFHPVTGMEYACIPRHPELGSYKVLDSVNDSNTGLQAMAVAPVDQNGQPDTTQITIAYAGTHDTGDYRTDAASVGFGIPTAQMRQADDFAKHIINTYKPADLSFTGRSLGGYTAMSMAGKYKASATTFNAPSALNNLSSEAKAYIARNPDKFNNYIVSNDLVGNFGLDNNHDLGTTVHTGKMPKKYKFYSLPELYKTFQTIS